MARDVVHAIPNAVFTRLMPRPPSACLLVATLPTTPTPSQMIKTPELEQALLVLPFSQVESLANFLVRLLAAGLEVELCARCAVFLLRVHQVRLQSRGNGGVVLFVG